MSQNKVKKILEMDGICKTYGVVKALSGVSFSIDEGEIHTILGENGAGKSTLVKIITGEVTPDAGSLKVNGKPVKTYAPTVAHGMGIRMVHQELAVFENMSVAENVYPDHSFTSKGKIDYGLLNFETQKQLDAFGLKTVKPTDVMGSITLAGQQMVEIIRCIAANPRIIILDEPTSGLNDEESERLLAILKELKKKGLTIIYISHKLKEIMSVSDRVSIMRDGEYMTTMINDENLTENDLINSMVGRNLSLSLYSIKSKSYAASEKVVFRVKGLEKHHALYPTDLALKEGEILGVFGLEGSGTTKLSRIMYGLERSDGGHIEVEGMELFKITPQNLVEQGVMYLNGNRKLAGLLLDMPITDNISLPILGKLSKKLGFINTNELETCSADFVEKFSIALPSLGTTPRQLSGGNQQKVMLSACLAPEPKILIVNEPTRGIDVTAKAEIHRFLIDLAKKGVGIIVFSSELPEVMSLADRIIVMKNNTVSGELACTEFTEPSIMQLATVGRKARGEAI